MKKTEIIHINNLHHFTEDSLLSAMERAGAEDMGDEVERKGFGTPATRVDVIPLVKGLKGKKGSYDAYLIPERIEDYSYTKDGKVV